MASPEEFLWFPWKQCSENQTGRSLRMSLGGGHISWWLHPDVVLCCVRHINCARFLQGPGGSVTSSGIKYLLIIARDQTLYSAQGKAR